MSARFYIDCEFDGHGGPLLSIALVGDYRTLYVTTDAVAHDPWVVQNVVPIIDSQPVHRLSVGIHDVGEAIKTFLDGESNPVIIADSPVDIGRFCQALSTGSNGGWASAEFARMTFEVHNVDCYPTDMPGAIQHNAWWDAMALRHRLAGLAALREGE